MAIISTKLLTTLRKLSSKIKLKLAIDKWPELLNEKKNMSLLKRTTDTENGPKFDGQYNLTTDNWID